MNSLTNSCLCNECTERPAVVEETTDCPAVCGREQMQDSGSKRDMGAGPGSLLTCYTNRSVDAMSGQGVLKAEKECLENALTKLGTLVEMLLRAKDEWAYMDDDDQTQLKDSIRDMGGESTTDSVFSS